MILGVFTAFMVCFSSAASAKPLQNQGAIDAFYLEREGKPVWLDDTRIGKRGKRLLDILKKSWQNGLNPNSYNVAGIESILDQAGWRGRLDDVLALQLELLLTDSYVEYARDLSGMRIRARDLELNHRHWRKRMSAETALSLLTDGVRSTERFLRLLEPQTATYKRLKQELVALVEQDERLDPEPLRFKGLLRPGRGDSNVPKLRERFGLHGVAEEMRYTYDPILVDAVKAFQADKGLKPDGVIGKQTLHILNQGRTDKIRQLIANMERLRWVPDEKPDRFIIVNIPAARLWAVENGKVQFEMPVVVGRKKRPTLSFITQIHGVRFNPTWTIPPTILEEDLLPKLQEDPQYLTNKGIELYDGYEKDSPTLDPTVVDWASVTEEEWSQFKMVQVPGSHNPLGRVRVLMPNSHNIYLHDTYDRSLFHRSDRARSSGCVRMQDPERVAMFALEKRKNWSEKRMKDVLKTGKLKDIYTSERMPVYLMYYTVWIGDNNQIVYGQDIYGDNKKLLYLLEKLDGFAILSDPKTVLVHNVD